MTAPAATPLPPGCLTDPARPLTFAFAGRTVRAVEGQSIAAALYAAGGVYTWVTRRDWRAGASAGLVAGVVLAVGVVEHLPSTLYQASHQKNPITNRTDSVRGKLRLVS